MNKRKITMKLFSLKKLLSNKKTSLLLLFLLLISGALFAKSSINQNKNLDNGSVANLTSQTQKSEITYLDLKIV